MGDQGIPKKRFTLLKVLIGLIFFFSAASLFLCLMKFNVASLFTGVVSAALGYYLSIGSIRALKVSILLFALASFLYLVSAISALFYSWTLGFVVFGLIGIVLAYFAFQQIRSKSLRDELAERAILHKQAEQVEL